VRHFQTAIIERSAPSRRRTAPPHTELRNGEGLVIAKWPQK
jgi:hypothetical protein